MEIEAKNDVSPMRRNNNKTSSQTDTNVLDSEYLKGVVCRVLVFEKLCKKQENTCSPVIEARYC